MDYPLVTAQAGYGVVLPDPEALELYWQHKAGEGFPLREPGVLHHDVRKSRKSAVAYVNHGRWLFDCPECQASDYVWPGHTHALCTGCGTRYKLKSPSEAEIRKVEKLLDARGARENQNWNAHWGESVKQLAAENSAMAVGSC